MIELLPRQTRLQLYNDTSPKSVLGKTAPVLRYLHSTISLKPIKGFMERIEAW